MNIDKLKGFIDLIGKSDSSRVSYFFDKHKERIHAGLLERLQKEPRTPYLHFVLETPEGYQRSWRYVQAFGKALEGDINFFLTDQENIGKVRAVEGHKIQDIVVLIITLKEILSASINEHNRECSGTDHCLTIKDIFMMNLILDYSYIILSDALTEARDRIINRRRNQLHELQCYSAKVVSIFNREDILDYLSRAIFDIFGFYGLFTGVDEENGKWELWNNGESGVDQRSQNLMRKTIGEVLQTCQAHAITGQGDMTAFSPDLEEDYFKFICTPILDRDYRILGVLSIHNQGNVFTAEKFDKDLLYQLFSITGAVLSNSIMVQEIANKREELRSLTGHLISFQEEERKRIAGDIHDTLTQALTGIGYKALLCQKLIERDPGRLKEELKKLIMNIDETLIQSRQITGNLRPKILDDIGITAAFRKVLKDFQVGEKVQIKFSCPKRFHVNSQIGITFFRILQEALQNIKKHSKATRVDVSLTLDENNSLSLLIRDNGCGFDANKKNGGSWNSGLGLIFMRERAEDLGGKFQLGSKPGKGCQIKIELSLDRAG